MTRDDIDKPGDPADAESRAIRILTERLERLAGDTTLRGERLVDLAVENTRLRQEIATRFTELAELTRLYTEAETEHARQLSEAKAELAKEIGLREQAEAFAEAVTSSSVWRATAPLRWFVARLTGRT